MHAVPLRCRSRRTGAHVQSFCDFVGVLSFRMHACHHVMSYLCVVDLDDASLALAVEAEELLADGLGQVQRHVQRADDPRVSVRQEVLQHTPQNTAAAGSRAERWRGGRREGEGGRRVMYESSFAVIPYW